MTTLLQLSIWLRQQLLRYGGTQESLRLDAGISRQTLTNVLSGTVDYKVTTLLAVADRLGLDVVLVPKGAVAGLQLTPQDTPPLVKTGVQAALEKLRAGAGRQENGS